MSSVAITVLFLVLLYVGKLWLVARSTTADLRTQVAYLKRRLARASR